MAKRLFRARGPDLAELFEERLRPSPDVSFAPNKRVAVRHFFGDHECGLVFHALLPPLAQLASVHLIGESIVLQVFVQARR